VDSREVVGLVIVGVVVVEGVLFRLVVPLWVLFRSIRGLFSSPFFVSSVLSCSLSFIVVSRSVPNTGSIICSWHDHCCEELANIFDLCSPSGFGDT
jgi:hypothetical protein